MFFTCMTLSDHFDQVPGVAQPIALIACGEKGFATFDVTVAAQVISLRRLILY
jgi:hypothetical protein